MGNIVDSLDRGVVALSVAKQWASSAPDLGGNRLLNGAYAASKIASACASLTTGLVMLEHGGDIPGSPAKAFLVVGLISTLPVVTGINVMWRTAMLRRSIPPASSVQNAL